MTKANDNLNSRETKMEMTYDELNEIVHVSADAMEKAELPMDGDSRCELNDIISAFLQTKGVSFIEDEN